MKKTQQDGFGVIEGLLILIILLLVGFIGYYVYSTKSETDKNLTTSENVTTQAAEDSSKKVAGVSPQTGMIKGQASYPSEGLPADEEICAQDTKSDIAPVCINVGKNQTINYTLTVPVGTYHVYAQTASFPNYKAYYNEYSKCGNSVDCPDVGHKQYIDVEVTAGAATEGVDPGDWYAN